MKSEENNNIEAANLAEYERVLSNIKNTLLEKFPNAVVLKPNGSV